MDYQFIHIRGNHIAVKVDNVAEARGAIKELRVLKREYSLAKRSVTEQMSLIRARYTDMIRHQGSKFRGGGGVGRFIRTVQTSQRDAQREQLAKALAPLEKRKEELEATIGTIDQLIINTQSYIIKHS